MSVMIKESKKLEEKKYSQEYKTLRENAEKWPTWRKQYYNENFATSKHAKKFVIIIEDDN